MIFCSADRKTPATSNLNIHDFLDSNDGTCRFNACVYHIEGSGLHVPMGYTYHGGFDFGTIFTTGLSECNALIGIGVTPNKPGKIDRISFTHVLGGDPVYADFDPFLDIIRGYSRHLFIIETNSIYRARENPLCEHLTDNLLVIPNKILIYYYVDNFFQPRTFGINKHGLIGTFDSYGSRREDYNSNKIRSNPGLRLDKPAIYKAEGNSTWFF